MAKTAKTKEKPLFSLLVNVAIPAITLMKFSGEDRFGPVLGLLVALSFPVGYSLYRFAVARDVSFISILGFVSTLLTGGISLMELDPFWIAVKEAAVPLVIGLVVGGSVLLGKPLLKLLFYNRELFDVDKIELRLQQRNTEAAAAKLLSNVTWLVVASFMLSAILNFVLARVVVQSAPGTEAFNIELGEMQAYSFPVIVVPSMLFIAGALWWWVSGIKQLAGLTTNGLFNPELSEKEAAKKDEDKEEEKQA
jgi:intracellular septation protein A